MKGRSAVASIIYCSVMECCAFVVLLLDVTRSNPRHSYLWCSLTGGTRSHQPASQDVVWHGNRFAAAIVPPKPCQPWQTLPSQRPPRDPLLAVAGKHYRNPACLSCFIHDAKCSVNFMWQGPSPDGSDCFRSTLFASFTQVFLFEFHFCIFFCVLYFSSDVLLRISVYWINNTGSGWEHRSSCLNYHKISTRGESILQQAINNSIASILTHMG